MSELRILHVLAELKPSGAEVMLKVAGPLWTHEGIVCDILSTGNDIGIYANQLSDSGYSIHHIPFNKSIDFFRSFYKMLLSNSYDIVHLHAERASFWMAAIAKMAGVKKVVRTIHSTFQFTGWLRIKRAIQRRLLQILGIKFISIGSSVQENEWRNFRNKTDIIPNWYDDSKFKLPTQLEKVKARRDQQIDDDSIVIVSVGNCARVKNHKELVKALSMLPNSLKFLYLHVGLEDEGRSEYLLTTQLGNDSRVRFLGYQEDVYRFLIASDIFIMPSLYEGFGNTALEAMVSGVPSILADVEGLKDFKLYNTGIWWVKPLAVSIASAIEIVAQLPKENLYKYGEQLSNAISPVFNSQNGINSYSRLYRS